MDAVLLGEDTLALFPHLTPQPPAVTLFIMANKALLKPAPFSAMRV